MIEIKNPEVLDSLLGWLYHHKLRKLMLWTAKRFRIFITEGHREKRHPNDLHGTLPIRAIDIRTRIYSDPQKIADEINENWIYDPKRPHMKCAVYGDQNHLDHIHLQVHPTTTFIGTNE